ncbi:hypothetical protein [Caulobacter sp. 17J80-11]|uniref:hypothetical protein n=1 Tax=Caulobacter sp. 17J80-11 TaxID=2763502 RepID=UPI0016535BCE|nr:hypothetical protein [Caulobacter sp. 17J80-11]MBC6981284.1 hypothetical protein [Caulobacter sp. 17J80-11]
MNEAGDAAQIEAHLRVVWETLLRERQRNLARCVEGVLAEIIDNARDASGRVEAAARAWRALFVNPRGLTDFGIWREDGAERIRLNTEFDRHLNALHNLLR